MTSPHEWAALLSPSAYRYFMQRVVTGLDERGLAYELGDGGLLLCDRNVKVGLVNLAQQRRQTVPPKWPGLVAYLIDQVLAAANEGNPIEAL